MNLIETEIYIKYVKDEFEKKLAKNLNLIRVSAPMMVFVPSGLNDHLNGYERPVTFDAKDLNDSIEIVQSLAKWKRVALKQYGFEVNTGLYTDMNAIRRDEDLDAIHSIYVDQFDWEAIIDPNKRNLRTLKSYASNVYKAILAVARRLEKKNIGLKYDLPDKLTFISSQDLYDQYPNLSSKERELAACKKYGAIFLYQIGGKLKNGKPHDGRAPDYDDWLLNGDIILYYDVLNIPLELSSMGIRVNKDRLLYQLKERNCLEKLTNPYCEAIMNDQVPQTIGGGIGESRLAMFFLKKHHIGEVQASLWPEEMKEKLKKENINLL